MPALAQQDSQELPSSVDEGQRTAIEAPAPESKAGGQSEASDRPPGDAPSAVAPVQREGQTDPADDARRDAAEQREKDDLVAQQSMARSTAELVILTYWQLAVGIVGIALLLYTLKLTRAANNAANRAAEAAEDAVEVTRDTAHRQLRAYVFTEARATYNLGPGAIPKVHYVIKNTGLTPAYDVINFHILEGLPHPLRDDLLLQFPDLDKTVHSKTIIPAGFHHNTFVETSAPLTNQQIADIADGSRFRLYLMGVVQYRDAFNVRRKTAFCGSIGGESFRGPLTVAIQHPGNAVPVEFEYGDKHNEAT